MAPSLTFWLVTSALATNSSAFSILPGIPKSIHHYHPSSSSLHSSKLPEQQKLKEEECLLIPETNPNSNPNATSLSGVPYSLVNSAIDDLYPPYELSSRNAKSRKDGYWKYVERGEKPPQEFTYGEFDIEFFGMLLDRTWELFLEGNNADETTKDTGECDTAMPPWTDKTFCDIGSGAGRLVLTAAALHPQWKVSRGLEILQGLHDMSTSIIDQCGMHDDDERQRLGISGGSTHVLRIPLNQSNTNTTTCISPENAQCLPLAPIKFTCGSFTNPYEYLGDIDCAFVFSSCMKPDLVKDLSLAIGRQCKPGTIIITTEFPLFLTGNIPVDEDESSIPHGPYEIQLLEKIDGWCWLMGGVSSAYIHRVKTSLWEEYGGLKEKPQSSLEEEAFRLVQAMENGDLTDTDEFLRRVRNDMIFHCVPPEFIPEID